MSNGKVYLVTYGEYSDYSVCAAFSTEEKAQAAIEGTEGYSIEEYELDSPLSNRRGLSKFSVSMEADGNTSYCRNTTALFDAPSPKKVLYACTNKYSAKPVYRIIVDCWAKDEQHAIKITNECRIMALAAGDIHLTITEVPVRDPDPSISFDAVEDPGR